MKKLTILLAMLLVGMLAAVSLTPLGLPEQEALVSGPAQQENGTVLAAENRLATARIYTLESGRVRSVYEENRIRLGRESRIVRVAAMGADACFVRVLGDGLDWELVKLENGRPTLLCQDTFSQEMNVTGLKAQGNSCWITAVGENKAIFIYEYTAAEGAALRMVLPAWWLWGTVTAEYDGEVIRAATMHGDNCFLTVSGEATYSEEAAQTPLPLVQAVGLGWLACKRSALLLAAAAWAVIAAVVMIAAVISRRAARLVTRLTAVSGAAAALALLAANAVVFGAVCWFGALQPAWQTLRLTMAAGLAIWLVMLALIWKTAGKITRPALGLAQQMDRVAEGDAAAREPVQGNDELSRADRALQMLCMNLSIWKYESAATIRSYKRFVPEKMPELLDRPVAEEIQLGDSHRMEGNVGIFSVRNRAEVRNALDDGAFLDFINHSFSVFHSCVEENHGWMLSSALRLSDMEALFPQSPADGVWAGLDFMGKIQVQAAGNLPKPRACLILHKASFLYGISGQEERLFPHLSSAELECLGGYARQLDEVGVRIAVTEAYWKQLEGRGFTGRYIGFVSAGERNGAYKLYEVLDTYPELERELRRGYDQRFQEAINLFYHNDFYLARNLFSTLLRACPSDGVARWYLFACERFFNEEGTKEPDYSLFGTEE